MWSGGRRRRMRYINGIHEISRSPGLIGQTLSSDNAAYMHPSKRVALGLAAALALIERPQAGGMATIVRHWSDAAPC